jgi:hypothetical protein
VLGIWKLLRQRVFRRRVTTTWLAVSLLSSSLVSSAQVRLLLQNKVHLERPLRWGRWRRGLGLLGSLAGLGQQQRAADIQGAQLLETIGRDIRAEDQARLDMSYEDFVRQRDFPIQQYERMAGILRGVPVTPNVEEQRMVSYSPTQQALGAGISALGLYRGLTA